MVWARAPVGVYPSPTRRSSDLVSGSVLAPPRVQLAKALLARSALKLTVPVGAVAESGVRSATVAAQLPGLPPGPPAAGQLTSVLVSCLRAVTTKVPELLRWLASPP